MVNGQPWFDLNYPISGTCTRTDDKENYGKKREEIVNLDISNQNLEGCIIAPGFYSIRKLNCSFNRISCLLGYPEQINLEEVDYSHNQH
ncbi:11111_t:CDS:1, partial [Racocetra fulgida]